MRNLIDIFQEEKSCDYKGEQYQVRDNGAVYRFRRPDKRKRPLDEVWTFGNPNNHGYMLISGEVVSRIVATAFHGKPKSSKYIVDHIDTNRQNNRPENLRWLSRLENILNNPVTLKRIVFHCGSIEAFLDDPSILKKYINENPNFDWMRTVTPEEARISWERISRWAEEESSNNVSKGEALGEWIFKDNNNLPLAEEIPEYHDSLTDNAIQKDWKTSSEFPLCPQGIIDKHIVKYYDNLMNGKVFSRNQYSDSIIVDFAISNDEKTLWVLCMSSEENLVKPWTLAQVTFEDDVFAHSSLGSYFKKDGVEKYFALAQGKEWMHGDRR